MDFKFENVTKWGFDFTELLNEILAFIFKLVGAEFPEVGEYLG